MQTRDKAGGAPQLEFALAPDAAPATPALPAARVLSVSDLNRLARESIERALPLLWVAGEISNFMRAASGHCYFSLKDAQAQVRCVLFRHKAQLHDWQPHNGMQVEVRALPSLYEARGEFQLTVETLRRSGLGALYEAFEKLKAKLHAEGLFDAARKRALPRFPRTVGIVTSLKAAALRDVLTTLRRRMPAVAVVVYPCAVQGQGAAADIAQAVNTASARAECDVLIVCRGGGSIEDLWAFNEEVVARAIAGCGVPVVSGVGHETDFTIADFAADVRAPTPTAAAELVCPHCDDLRSGLGHLQERLARAMQRASERRMQSLDVLARRLVHPGERIAAQCTHLAHLARGLRASWRHAAGERQWLLREHGQRLAAATPDLAAHEALRGVLARRLASSVRTRLDVMHARAGSLAAQLAQLNPQAVLERGYSLVENGAGTLVRDSAQLTRGQTLKLSFARGTARATVDDKDRDGDGDGDVRG